MSEVEGKINCCGESEDDDNSWVFDSLVNFLHGPIWQLPVFGFIEEKSVVFDPDSYKNLSEENEIAYRKIHDEYKGLVDFMLGNFMEDLGVSPSQVEEACRSHQKATSEQMDSQVTKMALEQLWAAEDFQAFQRLMTRKNIDLQLQSLELLVSKYGILSPSLSSDEAQDEDDAFLQLVISQIKEQELGESGAATEQLKKPPKQIPKESVVTATIENSGQRSLDIPDNIHMDVVEQKRQLTDFRKALEVEDDEVSDSLSEEMQALMTEKLKSGVSSTDSGITEEMIQSRREYMRSQRDKLVALKRREREKLLAGQDGDFNGSSVGGSRPKSARAAQLAMKSPSSIGNNNDNKALLARRALADRMKHELMRK